MLAYWQQACPRTLKEDFYNQRVTITHLPFAEDKSPRSSYRDPRSGFSKRKHRRLRHKIRVTHINHVTLAEIGFPDLSSVRSKINESFALPVNFLYERPLL